MPLQTGLATDYLNLTRPSAASRIGPTGAIEVVASNTPRFDYNPNTLEPLGLLVEEQRTNLLLNSETLSTQSVAVSATPYTLSFYGTGTVTLSGASTAGPLVGAGAFPSRVTLTFTPSAGTLTLTVSGTVEYAQLEAGGFATSYIPTTGASATRSGEIVYASPADLGVANVAGTLIINFRYSNAASDIEPGDRFAGSIFSTETTGNPESSYAIHNKSGYKAAGSVFNGGTSYSDLGTAGVQPTSAYTKVAIAFDADYPADANLAFCQDGGTVLTSTASTYVTSADILTIGSSGSDYGRQLNGHVAQVTYFPRRLTNAELQARTA